MNRNNAGDVSQGDYMIGSSEKTYSKSRSPGFFRFSSTDFNTCNKSPGGVSIPDHVTLCLEDQPGSLGKETAEDQAYRAWLSRSAPGTGLGVRFLKTLRPRSVFKTGEVSGGNKERDDGRDG